MPTHKQIEGRPELGEFLSDGEVEAAAKAAGLSSFRVLDIEREYDVNLTVDIDGEGWPIDKDRAARFVNPATGDDVDVEVLVIAPADFDGVIEVLDENGELVQVLR